MLWQASLTLMFTALLIIASLFAIKILFSGTRSFKEIRDLFKNRINIQKQIQVEEVLFLDNKKKIVLIKYKNNKYLLLISSGQSMVIEKFQE